MGDVVDLRTVDERAAIVRSFLAAKHEEMRPQLQASGKVVRLDSVRKAVEWGEDWMAYADSIETALRISEAQRKASEMLLQLAETEILRLRGLIE